MKSKQYYDLVRKYESEAQSDLGGFDKRVRRLLLLGKSYIWLITAIAATIFLLLAWLAIVSPSLTTIVFVILSGLFVLGTAKNLFNWIEPPSGIYLNAAEFPELFADIDLLRDQMDIPAINQVVINYELNACAAEYNTSWLFGKRVCYLGLGMPLLESLTPEEIRAVIAHEIAHLARGHSQTYTKVWRVKNSWMKILDSESGNIPFWWRWFASYYGDYFEAMTSVLSRNSEFEADRIAASVTPVDATISGHLATAVHEQTVLVEDTKRLEEKARSSADPPKDSVSQLIQLIRQPLSKEKCRPYLRRTMAHETSIFESHPSRRDRVLQIGFPKFSSLDEAEELASDYVDRRDRNIAADYYLGKQRDTIIEQLDKQWSDDVSFEWAWRHDYLSEVKNELNDLEKKINESNQEPSELDLARIADLEFEYLGQTESIPAYKRLVQKFPSCAPALITLGCYYYDQFQLDAAEEHFLKAVECDLRYETDVSHYMVWINRERENYEDAKKWEEHGFGASDELTKSNEERAFVDSRSKFISADLNDQQIDSLVEQFVSIEKIRKVWVARKKLDHYSDSPLYIFGIEPTESFFVFRSETYYVELANKILEQLRFNHQFFLVVLKGQGKEFKKKFRKHGNCIFERQIS